MSKICSLNSSIFKYNYLYIPNNSYATGLVWTEGLITKTGDDKQSYEVQAATCYDRFYSI